MAATLATRRQLGMLTPSSNTVLEPMTAAMLADLPDVSVHFGRFPVTEISFGEAALGQFETGPMLAAAGLLADARMDAICWNGTSAGWLGLETDERLCTAIEERTGIPACSSVLALVEIFQTTGVRRFGLVTPYLDDIQRAIVDTFEGAGFPCPAERHLGDPGNYSFAEVDGNSIRQMCREVARNADIDAITIFCTNLRGADVVADMETELGLPIYDTVATALWASLKCAGVSPARVKGWGRLFQEVG
ncbi:MAG: maleate cis-trans isomerase family protein [Geminicoccaceae bacterium]